MRAECPSCRSPLQFSNSALGKEGRCNTCGAVLRIGQNGGVSRCAPDCTNRKNDLRPRRLPSNSKEPGARGASPRLYVHWLAAGAIALVAGFISGFFICKPSVSDLARTETHLAAARREVRQMRAESKALEAAKNEVQRRLMAETTRLQSATIMVSRLADENRAAQSELQSNSTQLAEARKDGELWKARAVLLQDTQKVLQAQLKSLVENQAAVQRLVADLRADEGRQADLKRAQDRLALLLAQAKQAEAQAEAARKKLETASRRPVRQPVLPPTPAAGGSTIESRIDGTFQGWTGETVFKLQNGQIWQQARYAYHYHYAFMPKVTIYKVTGGWEMKVDGVGPTIRVKRLK